VALSLNPQSRFEVYLTRGRQSESCAGGRRNHRYPGKACEKRCSQEAPARSEPRALLLFSPPWPKPMAHILRNLPLIRPRTVFNLMYGSQSGR